jgi:Aldo/keto reductase family
MTMRYRILGGTGIEVSAYCLGTMMFGALGGAAVGNPDHDECIRIINAALDRGINFIDTADMYSAGECEQITGSALRGRRDDVILATKGHFALDDGRGHGGNSRRWIIRAVEDSLRRLQTDWIDLYQIHRPDESTDIEETLSVLSDLVHQGKIRAFGCSSFPAHHIVEAYAVASRCGLLRFRTEQPPYSLLARGIEESTGNAVATLCAHASRTRAAAWPTTIPVSTRRAPIRSSSMPTSGTTSRPAPAEAVSRPPTTGRATPLTWCRYLRMNAMTRPVPIIDTVLPARNRRVAGDIRIVGMASDANDSNRQPSRVVSSCCGTIRWADRPGGR